MPIRYPRVAATFSNPASGGAYAVGDIIANSASAAAVVPITFKVPNQTGRITGCSCVVTPASGNLVIAALDFSLWLFRPVASIPFAAAGYPADNAALGTTAAAFRECIGRFVFLEGAWINPTGTLAAGVTGFQAVLPYGTRTSITYDTRAAYGTTLQADTLLGVVQADDIWTPGAVINRFDFILDIEADE